MIDVGLGDPGSDVSRHLTSCTRAFEVVFGSEYWCTNMAWYNRELTGYFYTACGAKVGL